MNDIFQPSRVSPSGRGQGGSPHYPKNWLVPPCPLPTVLTQKCRFCHFHAVFDHFAQIVSPPVDPIWETLPRAVRYNLRSQIDFTRPNVNSEHFGISFLRYMAVKVWGMVPNDMKNVNEIETFKNNIRKWKPVNCHCKLCLDYFLSHRLC